MNKEKCLERLLSLVGSQSNRAFAKKCEISEATVRNIKKKNIPGRATLEKIAQSYNKPISWLLVEENQNTKENLSDYQASKQKKDLASDIERLERLHFKQLCPAYFDEFFDFIAENYGENKEAAEAFLKELQKTHSNYRTWMEEKTTRTDNQTGGKEPNEMTG